MSILIFKCAILIDDRLWRTLFSLFQARRRLAVLNASNNCGPTLRSTICKTPKTSNSSSLTRKWQRFSEMIRSVLSEWPSFCLPICLKMNVSKKLSKPNYKIIQLFWLFMISHHELLCLPIAIFLTYNKPNKIWNKSFSQFLSFLV